MRKFVPVLALTFTVSLGGLLLADHHEKKPKYKISEVMQKALKGKTLKDKIVKGEASAKETLQFLDMMIALSSQKPPKGDEKSWKKFTDATLVAAAKVAVGRKDAAAELKKATNCAACHKAHKPPAKK